MIRSIPVTGCIFLVGCELILVSDAQLVARPAPIGPPELGLAPSADPVCYPGADESWTTCLPLANPLPRPADYDYPDPLGGSLQYVEPALFLDLTEVEPDLQLAPNFTLDEIAQAWKGQYAVVQPHAMARVQHARDSLGALIVNSGYRSPGYNATIPGSASASRHMYGDAFDLDPAYATLDELHDECWAQGAAYVGVYETHVHCDWRDDPVDPTFFGLAGAAVVPGQVPRPVRSARIVHDAGILSAPAEGWDEGEPLRRWWAFDELGNVVAYEQSATFEPPPDAVEVRVNVGLELELSLSY